MFCAATKSIWKFQKHVNLAILLGYQVSNQYRECHPNNDLPMHEIAAATETVGIPRSLY